jgi:hypothetical protein
MEWNRKKKMTRAGLSRKDRLMGRPSAMFPFIVAQQMRGLGMEVPQVIRNDDGTVTVQDNYLGVIALVSRWDSLLADTELANLRDLVAALRPMGEWVQTECLRRGVGGDHDERNGIGP